MTFDTYHAPNTVCRRGIILAGGTGSRLVPMTWATNKHLLPVYDKPMIYYPLTTLMLVGIREVLIISNEQDLPELQKLLGDGSQWGLDIQYQAQYGANGIAEALIIGELFVSNEPFALILGDNIFYGHGLPETLIAADKYADNGVGIVTYQVANPEDYGVLTTNKEGSPVDLSEKPTRPRSNRAVTGLYFYCAESVSLAKSLKPSKRGELEISDLNRSFLEAGRLNYTEIGRGSVWFDVGTTDTLFSASTYIELLQDRQSIGIAFPEEVALRFGYINLEQFKALITSMPECKYRMFLEAVLSEALENT